MVASLASTTVTIWFGGAAVANPYFTIGDPVRGQLDGAYGLASGTNTDSPVDVSTDVWAVDIRRGRSRPLDDIPAGTCTIVLDNAFRTYDPAYTPGPFYGHIRPGKKVTVSTNDVMIFSGFIEDWDLSFDRNPGGGGAVAVVSCVDALASLAAMEFDEWTTTAGQTAGERLTDVFARSEVNWDWSRDLDDGVSVLQGDYVSWGSNVLNYAQLVTRTDMGRLFASRAGVLTFRDRRASLVASTNVVFTDGSTGAEGGGFLMAEDGEVIFTEAGDPIEIDLADTLTEPTTEVQVAPEDVEVDFGNELLYNRVSVDREGGIRQTVNDTDSQATPPDGVGVRSLTLSGLLLESDAESADYALFLLDLYSDPIERVAAVTVDIHNVDDADKGAVLALDIADLARVIVSPHSTAPAYDRTCIVEGAEHTIRPFQHVMRIPLSGYEQPAQPFTIEDPVLGALDGVGQLVF